MREIKERMCNMSGLGNKEIFAKNLAHYVYRSGRDQKEIAETVGVAPSTFNEWVKGKKYPRIDKIEMLANYFGILKSDLIEDHGDEQTPPPEKLVLSEGEKILLELFRQIPDDAQKMYLEVLRASLKNQLKD
jgi:transcriptional regulator with XRE-family HTH domain